MGLEQPVKRILLICALSTLHLAAQSNSHGLRLNGVQTADLITLDEITGSSAEPSRPLSVQFETWVEQLPREHSEGVFSTFGGIDEQSGKASIRRVIQDHFHNIQIGYVVTVEADPSSRGYRVAFEDVPATSDAEAKKGWVYRSPEAHPVPQFVQNGDMLKVNLYTRQEHTRLVEYVRIGRPRVKELRDEAPRDAFAEDAEFSIARPSFRANGRPVASTAMADLHGPVLRVSFPGFGTYVLSLKPHEDLGFEPAGEVSGNSVTFMAGGNVFRIDCAERVASGSAAYNVYALLDSTKESPASVTLIAGPEVGQPRVGR
jgi:hypothetical protein